MNNSYVRSRGDDRPRVLSLWSARRVGLFLTVVIACCLALLNAPVSGATWGPYNLTTSMAIYSPSNQGTSLNVGWYTTTAGTGASRSIMKADDAYMATMPTATLVTGSTFTIVYYNRYSTTANNPVNMYRIGETWTSAATWTSPWGAGGNYSSVGTAAQDCINPTVGTVYTYSPGAGYNFPYGVLFRGATESSITYRKTFYTSPYPTLAVNYTPPSGAANGVPQNWNVIGTWPDALTTLATDFLGQDADPRVSEATMAARTGAGYDARTFAVSTQNQDQLNAITRVPVLNFGFETPAYGAGGYAYTPAGASWTFSGAGIARNGSPWFTVNAPEGSQGGFVQNLGYIEQSFTLAAGQYTITFSSIGRAGPGPNPMQLHVDGNNILSWTPVNTAWTSYSASFTIATAGSHTIRFKGTAASPDLSSVIDNVVIGWGANCTGYGFVYVNYNHADNPGCYLGIGIDDQYKVWLNGAMVTSYTDAGRGGWVPDGSGSATDFKGPFTLKQGWNRLLIKAHNGTGGYGWSVRLANADRTYIGNCTFAYSDATVPTNPTGCTDSVGSANNTWQNTVTDPNFTWSGAGDAQGSGEGVSGVRGYNYYWGTDPNGTSTSYTDSAGHNPAAVSDGMYYMRVATYDYALNTASWTTLYTFKYDGTKPVNPSATCDGGVVSDTWQNTNSAPTFTLSGASDATSGLKTTGSNARYRYYFGTDSNGTPATGTDLTDISPTVSGDGTHYLRVQTQDNAGNWSDPTTVFVFKYDGTAPTVGASPWISGSASFADAKVTLSWTNGSFSDPTPGSGLASLPLAVFEGAMDKSGDLAATETDLEIAENVAGGHTYTLKLRDNVGNVAAGPGLTVQVPASADNPWIYTGTNPSLSPPGMYPDYSNPTKVLTGFNSYKVHGISSGGTPDGAMMWAPFGTGGSVQGRVPVGYFPDATFKAFAGSQDNFVYCIDAAGGAQLWQHDMGSGNRVLRSCAAQFNVNVGGTPYNLIFAGSGNYSSSSNFLRAINAANGDTVWTFGSGYAVGAICGGPAVVPSTNTVYFTSMLASGGGSLWAVNTTDGTLRWSADIGNSDYSVSMNSTGTVVYAANNQGTLYAYNASTGALKWSIALDSGYDVLGAPAFAAGKLYVATAYDRVWCIIDNGAAASVNTAWGGGNGYVAIATPSQPVPIVNYYNAVYVGSSDGKLYELSMTNGSVNGYRDLGATTIGDPTVDPSKERIYVGTSDGRVHAFTVPF